MDAPDGNLLVYLYPGQTKAGVWPVGGDLRYTISVDGKKILEKRKLHNAVLDMETKPNQAGGYHVHVISDVPEDTDVFYVLNRRPAMPEYVGTQKQMFVIDKDGSIAAAKN